ncbi:arylsulfatase [Nocardia sp. NPDC055321]
MTNSASHDPRNLDRSRLPIPDPPFQGTIGTTYEDSVPDWPDPPSAPAGAPNVVIMMLDDVGFGQVGTFGGPVPTPALDKLAEAGLRYNRFHTTAICGPSRAALLTGRNHHNCGAGFLAEWATGFPSYTSLIPKSTATIGRTLRENGYNTAWFGKNHNTPDWLTSVVGPFDRWPTGLGFDYFFGFNAGETNSFYPALFENTRPVEPDRGPEDGYHFMTDITDRAIEWLRYGKSVNPDKPAFLYFAPGAMHAPHQVTQEWRDRFRGQFDKGWDAVREETFQRQLALGVIPPGTVNTPRPDWVDPWDSLSEDEKRVCARFMENYAGYLAFVDQECGRLIDAVNGLPDADNTLLCFIVGDNGASSEGGPRGTVNEIMNLNGIQSDVSEILARIDDIGTPNSESHYPMGWAWAGNAPFQWVKQVASHLGGTRNPMIVTWPSRITEAGGIRSQFTHLIDIVPTILDIAGIPAPDTVDGIDQKPMDGVSIASTFDSADARPTRSRQYFEILGNRAIYDDGWIACAQHTRPWRMDIAPGNWEADRWELYNLDEDFSESLDLADQHPDKLAELKELFDRECVTYGVYPLDDRGSARLSVPKPAPGGADPNRTRFTYYPGTLRLPETAAPNTKNRSHAIEVILDGPGDGILVAAGGSSAGYVLYVHDGRPVYHYNYFGSERTIIESDLPLPDGPSTVRLEFVYDGGGLGKGGEATLFVNDQVGARDRIEHTVPGRFGIDTFNIGRDTGSPVSPQYPMPFAFTGTIRQVDIVIAEPGVSTDEARLHAMFDAGKDY